VVSFVLAALLIMGTGVVAYNMRMNHHTMRPSRESGESRWLWPGAGFDSSPWANPPGSSRRFLAIPCPREDSNLRHPV
jgi:hypothetical protein